METEIATLRDRLQQEEQHLDWFTQSGQRMDASGVDTTDQYIAGVQDRIAKLRQQIASHSSKGAEGA
jgi:hypothetical protein